MGTQSLKVKGIIIIYKINDWYLVLKNIRGMIMIKKMNDWYSVLKNKRDDNDKKDERLILSH